MKDHKVEDQTRKSIYFTIKFLGIKKFINEFFVTYNIRENNLNLALIDMHYPDKIYVPIDMFGE